MSNYNYEENNRLENFVRDMGFSNKLNNTALHVYFSGIPYLEKKVGFCQPITASFKEIAKASFISIPSVKNALMQLNKTLCEITLGSSSLGEKEATCLRRFSQNELKFGKTYHKLKNTRPAVAQQLADILYNRTISYGGAEIKPSWSIGKTGRISSSNPNIQGHSKELRIKNLLHGLKRGEVLYDIDYKHAEPSIIQQAIPFSINQDPYLWLAEILGIERDDAKTKMGVLHYSRTSATKHATRMSLNDDKQLISYAEGLDELRERLWEEGAPRSKHRRFVRTIAGSIIEANRSENPHRGKILNWYAQGSIADFLNYACLRVIATEKHFEWRFLFPMHDAAYVIGKPEHEAKLKRMFETIPKRYGVKMKVHIEKHLAD